MDKEEIFELVRRYVDEKEEKHYQPGDPIPYAGCIYDSEELCNVIDVALEFWLAGGTYAREFERLLSEFLGVPFCSLVNSGSSANLLAVMALTSPLLGERRVQPGDEIITVACGFPTTVAPIIQCGAVPVFLDVSLPGYNVNTALLERARSSRTKAVIFAHTLGNPFDLKTVTGFCEKYGLWLIEDNCDALGSEYCLDGVWRKTGSFGDIGTSSFYPAHHIAMGEGGAVYTKNPLLHKILRSLRDWGRDCVCPPGHDNACGHRFTQQYGTLPAGYDHKYVYSHLGFNLKATDLQASVGVAQIKKAGWFIERRRSNWAYLREKLAPLEHWLILPEKEADTEPSWFGFLLTVRDTCPVTRNQITSYLEAHHIQTRPLFAGNLLRHPCFEHLREGTDYRIAGDLQITDHIMKQSFWIGVYPGMERTMLDEMIRRISEVCGESKGHL